jgi:hypothetical protein
MSDQSDVLRSTGLQPEKGPPTVQSVRMVTSPLLPLPSKAQQPGENAHVG